MARTRRANRSPVSQSQVEAMEACRQRREIAPTRPDSCCRQDMAPRNFLQKAQSTETTATPWGLTSLRLRATRWMQAFLQPCQARMTTLTTCPPAPHLSLLPEKGERHRLSSLTVNQHVTRGSVQGMSNLPKWQTLVALQVRLLAKPRSLLLISHPWDRHYLHLTPV